MKSFAISITIICLSYLFQTSLRSHEISTTTQQASLVTEALNKKLYKQKTWIKLVHYKKNKIKQSFKSDILSHHFFLSKNGKKNPKEELIATIKHYFSPPTEDSNKHPQCQFPARYHWLKENLNWPTKNVTHINCTQFKEWINIEKVNSIEILFATGYFGNPASFFGHPLIKIQYPTENITHQLLNQSINFGAVVPDNENPAIYLFKGLFGGYRSVFSDQNFFMFNHYYTEVDLRDLWAYQLNISKEDAQFLVKHIWEVLGNDFHYYFFDKNCAYYIADVFQLIIDDPLLNYSLPWALPSSIFERVSAIKTNNGPLIKKVTYIPSRQNRFYAKYNQLPSQLKPIFQKLIKHPDSINIAPYKNLSIKDKIKVIECYMDYNAYSISNKGLTDQYKQKRTELLIERFQLKEKSPAWVMKQPFAPHEGQNPTRFSLGHLTNTQTQSEALIKFRAAYYDYLTISPGRPQGSLLEMVDIELTHFQNKLTLKKLTLVSIETLGLSQTGLPQDSSLAWNLKFSFQRRNISKESARVFCIRSGFGKSKQLSSQMIVYGMLDGNIDVEKQTKFYVSPRASVIITPKKWISTQLTSTYTPKKISQQKHSYTTSLETRLGFSQWFDMRLSYENNHDSETKIWSSIYF